MYFLLCRTRLHQDSSETAAQNPQGRPSAHLDLEPQTSRPSGSGPYNPCPEPSTDPRTAPPPSGVRDGPGTDPPAPRDAGERPQREPVTRRSFGRSSPTRGAGRDGRSLRHRRSHRHADPVREGRRSRKKTEEKSCTGRVILPGHPRELCLPSGIHTCPMLQPPNRRLERSFVA